MSLPVGFWTHVKFSDKCWEWSGARDSSGYGKRGTQYAHRIAWSAFFGDVPEGLHVLHRCDNPSCVNPAHLFLGTQADNNQDSFKKDRHAIGEQCNQSPLTETDVVRMRTLATNCDSAMFLSEEFGVSSATVYRIVRGRSWRHLPGAIADWNRKPWTGMPRKKEA